ncbi:MAG: Fe-S cluster assembly protein SufD [Rhodothermaceae bacterium]|nr:MAG: Fe-S cluster assembly protein SufD [Rhodothermaceae bacterium]
MLTTLEKDTSTRPEARFLQAFEVHAGHTLNGSNPRLQRLRQEAIDHFRRLGFPARKAEAWKYTPITTTLRHPYAVHLADDATVTEADLAPHLIPDLDAYRVVLLNGRFMPALSVLDGLPDGVVVTSLAEATEAHAAVFDRHFARYADPAAEVFTALNTAFTHDGLFLHVPAQTVVEKPILLLSLTATEDDAFLQPRRLIVVDEGAQVTFIEHRRSLTGAKTFTSGVTEVYTGARAHVDTYLIQDEGPNACQVDTLHVFQETGSYASTNTITLSGEVVRNNHTYLPHAEHCETHLLGLFLGKGRMHVDNHTLVDHAQPQCMSNELFKGILDDEATGVFNGKVYVHPDAQQINAYQSNKSVLLSEKAQMYSKPELEIYADDVKCSHGATTGQLDREALFYLRARGLTRDRARKLLLLAFARDVVDAVRIEPLRAYLDATIEERLG